MKNIAILTGGDSAEHDISILSAKTVFNNLNKKIFKVYIVYIKNNHFAVTYENIKYPINIKDFSCTIKGKKIKFHKVFFALHGPPAENGAIQKYFEKLNISYVGPQPKVANLTFNKHLCSSKIKQIGLNSPNCYLHNKNDKINLNKIKNIGFPCISKPNASGSSFGISIINNEKEIEKAINFSLKYGNEVIIEEFVEGKEVSSGVLFFKNKIIALPLTEIISQNAFFDYDAKYNGKANEITPAKISKKLTQKIQNTSKLIYEKFKLNNICRIDYIIQKDKIYVIEINTIPGLSNESIIPKQLESANYKLDQIFQSCLLNS